MPSSGSEELFQRLLRELKPICARHGFNKRSQNFITESPDCWGILNFQRSYYADFGQKRFTINAAVAVKRILAFDGEPTDKPPVYYAAHWQQRIGHLVPANDDTWWVLSDEQSYQAVHPVVADAVESFGIPAVQKLMSEDALLDLWRAKRGGGFEFLRLKYQSVLLAERGLFHELGPVLFRLLEMSAAGRGAQTIIEHIAKLRAKYSIPDQLNLPNCNRIDGSVQ